MSSHDEFFNTKQAEAVFKHGILKRYPVVFASKTGSAVDGGRVVFLDGYAGRGEYRDGSPGSPLLLSQAAEFLQGSRDVLGFFVEQDDDSFANLERVLRDKGGPANFEVRHGSVDDHLSELLTLSGGASLFAFLDPFGPALDFNIIKSSLLGRPKWPPTEVLLHFSVLSVARMGRAVHAARQSNGALSADDGKTAARLDRFLDGGWWKDYFARVHDDGDEQKATDVAMRVCAEYQQRLTAGTRYQAISMPVRPRPDLAPKYVLMLLTADSEGAWCFADALGRAGRDWTAAWFTERMKREGPAGQGSLFGETPVFDHNQYEVDNRDVWTRTIAANIEALLAHGDPFKLSDRVPEVYGTVLGQAWERHVKAAVKLLHSSRKIDHDGKGKYFFRDLLHRG
ncbi:three-Cys-motif partner protein TcmP [Dactylosporangium sp. NPDC000244]|uniref:three-Cys-motif partner protein TcmP n=1 Tax=Dactylosporangium sp. NPDC000244 TaxID=3154365 RepID=UPI00332BAFD1